jgi:SAM-dependent methyltransferase
MLEVARQLAPGVEWRLGVAESLPFPDGCFDAVVSQFGLMFFDDPAEALRQTLRVLKPGGRLAFGVWDSLESIPAYADEVALMERLAGTAAADALRAPFALGNRHDLETLFVGAGVEAVEISTHRGTGRFPSVRVMVEADLRGWLPVMGVVLTEEQILCLLDAAGDALSPYVASDGTACFDTSAHVATGTKS